MVEVGGVVVETVVDIAVGVVVVVAAGVSQTYTSQDIRSDTGERRRETRTGPCTDICYAPYISRGAAQDSFICSAAPAAPRVPTTK